ncbi:amidohydrolase family protein [Nocardioides sp. NPDC004968]|uniref:metal-dependent hydrolase family protein n=1 Tax=Nocardioides sp. NPDC004968 TaxID=3155894 RepID=UPI0033A68A8C
MKINAGRLIDAVDGNVREGVAVEFGSTVDAIDDAPAASGAEQYTVMPGLVDAHVHLSLSKERFVGWRNDLSHAYYAFQAWRNAASHLDRGVTTVRDVGSIADVSLQLRAAIEDGVMEGPTIKAAGQWLNVTGGHGSVYGSDADGADGFRRAAREQIHHGADLIKVMVTAGAIAEEGRDPDTTEVTEEELVAVVDVTEKNRMPLAAHAHSSSGIMLSLHTGARSIEHGTWLPDEGIEFMVGKDVWLVPTLAVMKEAASDGNQKQAEIMERMLADKLPRLRKAIESGVRVAVGTDAGAPGTGHGLAAMEARLLVEQAGMSPLQAVLAATREAGELATFGERGTLQVGKPADILIVRGNPVEDITALENVECVIKDGVVVRGAVPSELRA